jgi:hypothetical protein
MVKFSAIEVLHIHKHIVAVIKQVLVDCVGNAETHGAAIADEDGFLRVGHWLISCTDKVSAATTVLSGSRGVAVKHGG